MIYVVAPTFQRFKYYCQDVGLGFDTGAPRNVEWAQAERMRGRLFEVGDQVVVLEGDWSQKEQTVRHLQVTEAVSSHPPIWVWIEHYDLPRSDEDLEDWLAR